MRDVYIVKKSVKRSPLKPKEKILIEEYQNWVDSTRKLTWSENTNFGKARLKLNSNQKLKTRSYLNFNEKDEKSFVQLLPPNFGYIPIQFDFKSTKQNLHDLIDLANKIDCNLWQYSPKRQVLTHEMVEARYQRLKPRAKKQTELHPISNWIYCEGSFEKFKTINLITFDKIIPTVARINNGISNNSIIAFEIKEGFFLF